MAYPISCVLHSDYGPLKIKSMRILIILLFASILVPLAEASPHVYSSQKDFANLRDSVSAALLQTSVSDSEWTIFIVPEKEWKSSLRKGQHGHTAYTLPGKLTYLNAEWLRGSSSEKIAQVLAHEYGHILCNCSDEAIAENYVGTLFHRR